MVNRVHTPWGYNKNGHSGGVHTSPEIFKPSRSLCWCSRGERRQEHDAATGFAFFRAALGDCPWASSAGRRNDCRRRHHRLRRGRSFHRDQNRHHPGRRRHNGQAEGRRNHGAGGEAVAGLPRYRAANHARRLHDRETFRRLARRALLLRTGRMRTPWGGRTRGPLECERQRPRRFLRRAHAALGRSWQS